MNRDVRRWNKGARIVSHIHSHRTATRVVIRADSGFCRDDLMSWCEDNGVQHAGLAGKDSLAPFWQLQF